MVLLEPSPCNYTDLNGPIVFEQIAGIATRMGSCVDKLQSFAAAVFVIFTLQTA